MRAFLMSIAAIIVIALVSVFVLEFVQETSAAAYSTIGVRI
jgi:hypothetical protein